MVQADAQTQSLLMLLLLALKIATVIGVNDSEWKGPDVDGKMGEGRCTGARYFYAPVAVRLVCPDKGCMREKQDGECSKYNTFRLCKDTMRDMGYTCDPAVRVMTAGEMACLRYGEPNPFFMIAPGSWGGEVSNTTAFFWYARRYKNQHFWFVDDMEIGKDRCAVQYTSVYDTDHYLRYPWVWEHAIRGNSNAMTDGYLKNELPIPSQSNDIRVGAPFVHSVSYPARTKCHHRSSGNYFPMYVKVDYIILYTYVVWGPGAGGVAYSGVRMEPQSLTTVNLQGKLLKFYNDHVKLTDIDLKRIRINKAGLGNQRPMYYRGADEGDSYWTRRCKEFEIDYHRCNTRVFFWKKNECAWMGKVEKPSYCGKACGFLATIWQNQ